MELRHLRYFVRVAEERHFGRAARDLGISQPPLSQQIRALETELGVALFDRTSRRVELTEAGRLFLPEAQAVLDQAAHAIAVARRVQLGELGDLAISFASSVPFLPLVVRALGAYRRRYPAIHLTLSELNRDLQIDGIANGQLDIGFIRNPVRPVLPSGITARQLVEDNLFVAIHEDHPLARENRALAVSDLEGLPIVFYESGLGAGFNEQIAQLFRARGLEFRVSQEVGGLATLLGVVAAGLGVTIMAQSLTALRADHMVWRLLDDPDAISRLWLIHREPLSLAAQRFADLLLEFSDADADADTD
jgi:DNA-binding transcriptional LysR family regulator